MADLQQLGDALRIADFSNVEVVGLREGGVGFEIRPGWQFAVEWSRPLTPEESRRLRTLIDALPNGTMAKCHMPPFGLRLGVGPAEIRVSLCFRCSNAYVAGTLEDFDATSAQAQALLAFLRACAPPVWKSPE